MGRHHILIVYGTSYGHTKKVMARMQQVFAGDGLVATAVDAATVSRDFDPSVYDGIVVGASVIGGKHQRSVRRFVMRHLETLNHLPSAFVSVSGSAGSADPRRQSDARRLMESWLESLAWHPDLLTTMGGAVSFTRYRWPLRWIMQRITRREGGLADASHDYDLTDWEHVEDFAHRFARIVEPVPYSLGVAT